MEELGGHNSPRFKVGISQDKGNPKVNAEGKTTEFLSPCSLFEDFGPTCWVFLQ